MKPHRFIELTKASRCLRADKTAISHQHKHLVRQGLLVALHAECRCGLLYTIVMSMPLSLVRVSLPRSGRSVYVAAGCMDDQNHPCIRQLGSLDLANNGPEPASSPNSIGPLTAIVSKSTFQ